MLSASLNKTFLSLSPPIPHSEAVKHLLYSPVHGIYINETSLHNNPFSVQQGNQSPPRNSKALASLPCKSSHLNIPRYTNHILRLFLIVAFVIHSVDMESEMNV